MKNPLQVLIEPRLPGIVIPVLIGCFLWTFPLFLPHKNAALWTMQSTPCTTWLNQFITPFRFFSTIIGFLFTLLISFLLVQLNTSFSFIRVRSLLLFFFFIVLIGSNISLHSFDFSQFGSIFLLLALWQLFSIYQQKQPVLETFNIGLFLALGSLFSIELLLFIPIFLIGTQRLNALTARTFLSTIIGIACPYILILGITYLVSNNIRPYIELYLSQFNFSINLHFDYISIIYLLTLFLTGALSIFNLVNDPFSNKIKVSRMLGFISFGFIYCILLFVFKSNNISVIFTLGTIFSAILYAHYYSLHSSIFVRILFGLQLTVCLIYYFSNLFSFIL